MMQTLTLAMAITSFNLNHILFFFKRNGQYYIYNQKSTKKKILAISNKVAKIKAVEHKN